MGEVDPAFLQEVEHRPNLKNTEPEEGIPLIDLSPDDGPPPSLEQLAKEIGSACKNWGFFQVINHGVPPEKLHEVESASKEFFGQSLEEKRKVRKDERRPKGYSDSEHTKNVRDWKEVLDFSLEDPTLVPASNDPDDTKVDRWLNQWPERPSRLREVCEEYGKEVEKLSFKLLELIALSLGLPAKRLHGFFKEQTSLLRLNHYRPYPVPDLALGVGRHTDSGGLTVLSQDDVGGLQVKRKNDGQWVSVTPIPGSYIVNVSCIIQVWSNGEYESVEHRVTVNAEKERFSIPFFLNPGHTTMVEPLEELVNEKSPAKYKPYNWGKFLITRKRGNFSKLGVENLQISHFRIA